MTLALRESSPSARGRILAALYLLVIAAGILGQAGIADRLIVAGDAAATAANIRADTSLYRLAFTVFMLEMVAQVGVSVLYYDLLKPVDRGIARIGLAIGLIGCGIKTMARLFYYVPLVLLGGAAWLSALPALQLETLSLLFIRINSQGAGIALVFFGFETILRGWLLFRSGFLPRFLGAISIVGGIGWLTWLWPPLGSRAFVVVALFALVGVVATAGWLLIRGVDDALWRQRAALASTSIWR